MCLFMPHISRHNKILVERDEDIPTRPVIPRLPGRICVIAPSFFEHNNVKVHSKKKTADDLVHVLRAGTQNSQFEQGHPARWRKVDKNGSLLVEAFEEEDRHSGTGSADGTIIEEVDEKQQMRQLEETDTDTKFKETKLRLDEAKKNFQKSMEKLSSELTLLKSMN
jgi:hypothetical protein